MTFLEDSEMRIRILLRALTPVACLWFGLYATRTSMDPGEWIEDYRAVFDYRFSKEHSWWYLIGNAPVILLYWWLHGSMIRNVKGQTFFRCLCEESAGKQNEAPLRAFLMFLTVLATSAALSWMLYLFGTESGRVAAVSVISGIAAYPLLFAFGLREFMDREMERFRKTLRHRKEAAKKRRQRAVVRVEPTFESRMQVLEREHRGRVAALKQSGVEADEGEYLLELEESRFHDEVRALTDPTQQS